MWQHAHSYPLQEWLTKDCSVSPAIYLLAFQPLAPKDHFLPHKINHNFYTWLSLSESIYMLIISVNICTCCILKSQQQAVYIVPRILYRHVAHSPLLACILGTCPASWSTCCRPHSDHRDRTRRRWVHPCTQCTAARLGSWVGACEASCLGPPIEVQLCLVSLTPEEEGDSVCVCVCLKENEGCEVGFVHWPSSQLVWPPHSVSVWGRER